MQIQQQSGSAEGSPRPDAPSPKRILVIDDEPDACEVVRRLLEFEGYRTTTETSALNAIQRLGCEDYDLVLTDVSMTELGGVELCRRIRTQRPDLPVILMTGRGSMDTVIEALRGGASDFLTKPLDADTLVGSIARALPSGPARHSEVVAAPGRALANLASTAVLGASAPIRQLYELIASLSESIASVVIQGETGTGKEVIARAIHATSRLRSGPFIAVSCAAIPRDLLESELFGHVRGAFTDAKSASPGLLVQANGGTLLLDELGELPLEMQPKLLRALQERKVRPVGGHRELPFDCRIIAATNRDLDREVAEGRFRADLYYRLDVVRMAVPPLRERAEDILLLARHFLTQFAKGGKVATLGPSAERQLLAYAWPGNVRELENCMTRAATLARQAELSADDLPQKVRSAESVVPTATRASSAPLEPLRELERRHILLALERFDGNKALAAERLGIDRSTLYRRLHEYGVGESR